MFEIVVCYCLNIVFECLFVDNFVCLLFVDVMFGLFGVDACGFLIVYCNSVTWFFGIWFLYLVVCMFMYVYLFIVYLFYLIWFVVLR